MKKIIWESLLTKGKNLEILLISFVALAFVGYKRRTLPLSLKVSHYRQLQGKRGFDQKVMKKLSDEYKKAAKENLQLILRAYQIFLKNLDKATKKTFSYKHWRAKRQSNTALIKFLDEWVKLQVPIMAYDYNYYLVDKFLPQILYNALKKKVKDPSLLNNYFEILTFPTRVSLVLKEKFDFLKMVNKAKKERARKSRIRKYLKSHLEKYPYFKYYYFQPQKWDIKVLEKRFDQEKKKDIEKELKQFDKIFKSQSLTKKLLKKLNFDKNLEALVWVLKTMATCINSFDEMYAYFLINSEHLWKEIARRVGVRWIDFIWMSVPEIKEYLEKNKKVDSTFRKELKQRKKDSALILEDGKIKILTGQKLKQYQKKYPWLTEKISREKGISGIPASSGKARGRVRIVRGVSDLKKIKKGDIMVTPMTVPAYLVAMEKSKAIVTDEGGLLCHAAIVSRELGIPCVVGTKIATKVLKDGNKVEVDATAGTVRAIKD